MFEYLACGVMRQFAEDREAGRAGRDGDRDRDLAPLLVPGSDQGDVGEGLLGLLTAASAAPGAASRRR